MFLQRPCPLAQDLSLTTKRRSGNSLPRHQRQRRHSQSEQLRRQCRASARRLRSPRGHLTSALKKVHRTQHPLRSERAACLRFLVAARSYRRGRRRLHHRLRPLLLPAGRAPTCRQHQLLRIKNVEKAITRATMTPTLHRVQSTRMP